MPMDFYDVDLKSAFFMVIPAKAGIQVLFGPNPAWMPACAGMTKLCFAWKARGFDHPRRGH
jgi:hypothetical protein